MIIELFQVDAFTNRLFSGNPAAICKLDAWLPDDLLQSIALENQLSETAFIVPNHGEYLIRWFTPSREMELCGHATLAAGYVIFHYLEPDRHQVVFNSPSGHLQVTRDDPYITLNFPSLPGTRCELPKLITQALGMRPLEVYSALDYLAVFETEAQIRDLDPDNRLLYALDKRGLIVTAPSTHCDFVSRYFATELTIPEDPVTGSAHCTLAPYWANKLGKTQMHAIQLSARRGELFLEMQDNRVLIRGEVMPYLRGQIDIRHHAMS